MCPCAWERVATLIRSIREGLADFYDRFGFERFDGCRQDLLCGEAVFAGAIYVGRINTVADLLYECVKTVDKRVCEITEATAKGGVRVNCLFCLSRWIQRHLAPHIVQDEPSTGPGDLAAFHWVASLDVVAAG